MSGILRKTNRSKGKEEDLLEVLESIDLGHYFGKVEARELVELILS